MYTTMPSDGFLFERDENGLELDNGDDCTIL
jgi:hypothetical protein